MQRAAVDGVKDAIQPGAHAVGQSRQAADVRHVGVRSGRSSKRSPGKHADETISADRIKLGVEVPDHLLFASD